MQTNGLKLPEIGTASSFCNILACRDRLWAALPLTGTGMAVLAAQEPPGRAVSGRLRDSPFKIYREYVRGELLKPVRCVAHRSSSLGSVPLKNVPQGMSCGGGWREGSLAAPKSVELSLPQSRTRSVR
jgi:hypothetical protein